jgi:hypothetical protein
LQDFPVGLRHGINNLTFQVLENASILEKFMRNRNIPEYKSQGFQKADQVK